MSYLEATINAASTVRITIDRIAKGIKITLEK